MVCVISFIVMMCGYLCCYLMNILRGWEFVYPAICAFPLWLYCKRDTEAWSRLCISNIFMLFLRFMALTVLGRMGKYDLQLPMTFDQIMVRQVSGLVQLVSWFFWFAVSGVQMLVTVKLKCGSVEDAKDLEHDHTIIRATNIFLMTTVSVIAFHVTALYGYSLNSVASNVIMEVTFIAILGGAAYILESNMVKERIHDLKYKEKRNAELKEAIVTLEREKESEDNEEAPKDRDNSEEK